MRKFSLMFLLLTLVFPAMQTVTLAQTPTFTVETIPLPNQGGYDMLISPDATIAAVYAGQTTLIFIGVPLIEYVVDPALLPIQLIDLTTGDEIITLTGHTDYVSDMAFTPDGTQLVSYHRNGDLIVWDIASGEQIQQFTAIMGLAQVKFLADGKSLVVHHTDSQIGYFLVWDIETGYITDIWRPSYASFGEIKLSQSLDNLDYRYTSFDISLDGTLMVTATANGEVALWDTATLERSVLQEKPERLGMLNVRQPVFSGDGETLAYYDSLTEQTHFWDVTTQTERTVIPVGDNFFGIAPNGESFVWATREDLWYVDLAQVDVATKILDFPDGFFAATPVITFTPDGSQFIVGGFALTEMADNLIYKIALN